MVSAANGTMAESIYRQNVVPLRDPANVDSKAAGRWERIFTHEGVHPYDEVQWKIVDAEIRDPSGKVKFQQKGIEVPEWWSQNVVNVVADKYFRVVDGVKERSVKQMFSRVVCTLRRWADEQDFFNSPKDAQVFEDELLFALLHQYGAFNSPVWFNLGIPGRRQAASACFISGVDDTLESICDFAKSEKVIFAGGSGSGANLSKIRSSYEKLSSGSHVCGPIGWMEELDKGAKAMKSGGSTRNAAKMVVMDMDHPDILETHDGRPGFIRCKAVEEQRAHDLIQKCGYGAAYDDPNSAYKWVSFQNANHSVSVPDAFMQAVIDDDSWETRERLSGEVSSVYKARDLWNEIAKAAWVCGDPGIQFTDIINRWHTTPQSGRIRSSNPCSEFLDVDDTACNLCAINLTEFFNFEGPTPAFDFSRFEQAVRIFSTAQMAIVDKADYPTEKIRINSLKLRPIGTNYGNLGALLMRLGYSYDSDGGRVIAARLASLMTGVVYKTAAKLAARAGAFQDFEANRVDMLHVMSMHRDADAEILRRWGLYTDPLGSGDDSAAAHSRRVWDDVMDLGSKYGFYIHQATLQAPLGTISFLMGMDTTGIEPAFSLVAYKSLVGGGFMKLVNAAVPGALSRLGYAEDQIRDICAFIEQNDHIEGAPHLKAKDLSVFDCAMPSGPSGRYLSPMAHIKMMASIQPLITCAQSKTVNLPPSATPEEIANTYLESWKLGVKCVALYRDGCKLSQPLATKARSDEQSLNSSDEMKVVEVQTTKRRHMPENVAGHRHRFEISGHKGYIVMNEYPDGSLGEVFLKLGKNGSTMGGLIDGFTQLLSISLQYGVPLQKLIRSFIHTKFEPSGFTHNPEIRFADSLYDYLFKLLDLRYFGGQHSGLRQRGVEHSEPDAEATPMSESDMRSLPPPAQMNLDAPPCSSCGAITRRNGSCYLCMSCGSSSGCS